MKTQNVGIWFYVYTISKMGFRLIRSVLYKTVAGVRQIVDRYKKRDKFISMGGIKIKLPINRNRSNDEITHDVYLLRKWMEGCNQPKDHKEEPTDMWERKYK